MSGLIHAAVVLAWIAVVAVGAALVIGLVVFISVLVALAREGQLREHAAAVRREQRDLTNVKRLR